MNTRQSEEAAALLQSALNALPMQVAVLDSDGVIRYTNRAWRTFGTANGLEEPIEEGVDYLACCESDETETGTTAAEGIRAVARGDRDEFSLEYDCHDPDEKRWFQLRATRFDAPVDPPSGGRKVLVAHYDITDRKLAERATASENERLRALVGDADSGSGEVRDGERIDEAEIELDRVPVDVGTLARSVWGDIDADDVTFEVSETDRIDADQALLSHALEQVFRAAVGAAASTVEVTGMDDGIAVLDDGDPLAVRLTGSVSGDSSSDVRMNSGWPAVRRVADAHGWSVERTDRTDGGVRVVFG